MKARSLRVIYGRGLLSVIPQQVAANEVFVNRNAEEEEGWEARTVEGDELKAASRHPDAVNHYHRKPQS